MSVIFIAILLYLLYHLVTAFLIPVFRTTRHVREKFHQMKGQHMNNQPGSGASGHTERAGEPAQNSAQPKSRANSRPNTSTVGEYIDFEDVKK